MIFHVITIFPEAFTSYLATSLLKRAQEKKIIRVRLVNLRTFTRDRHASVDDASYGGGPGMVIKVEPIYRAVRSLRMRRRGGTQKKTRVILFSTRGKLFDERMARRFARYDEIILIAGRYEGVDERVAAVIADEEVSIGSYILSGGELPALILIEAVSRHLHGFLGKQESLEEKKGSYPVYTRPEIFVTPEGKRLAVPKVLVSGNHTLVQAWREKHGKKGEKL